MYSDILIWKARQGEGSNFPNKVQDYYNNFASKSENNPGRLNAFR